MHMSLFCKHFCPCLEKLNGAQKLGVICMLSWQNASQQRLRGIYFLLCWFLKYPLPVPPLLLKGFLLPVLSDHSTEPMCTALDHTLDTLAPKQPTICHIYSLLQPLLMTVNPQITVYALYICHLPPIATLIIKMYNLFPPTLYFIFYH